MRLRKIRIDNFDATDEDGIPLFDEFMSTAAFDFSQETVQVLATDCGLGDCDFVGMTIKAGNNYEDSFKKKDTDGEGEMIDFGVVDGLLEDHYGKQNDIDCTVDAAEVLHDFFLVV